MMPAKRILLIHLFSNGDCLYATTVAAQIRKDYPDAHLIWAIAKNCRSMILNNPDINEVWEIDMPAGEDKEAVFERVLSEARNKKQSGAVDLVFCSQILGDNWVHYDGCVRTSIYRAYGHPVTVDKRPVLKLTEEERARALSFAQGHDLFSYKHVILYECAPLSGQAQMSDDLVMNVAEALTDIPGTAVILSSFKSYPVRKAGVIDGSGLTIRETAALASYCNLLLGCSSGITWAVHSQEFKAPLCSIQLLNRSSYIFNPPSIAMERAGEDHSHILELFEFDSEKIKTVVSAVVSEGFDSARRKFNRPAKKQFRIYRGVTHQFIKKRRWDLLKRFVRMNLQEHGLDPDMLLKIAMGVILYPLDARMSPKK